MISNYNFQPLELKETHSNNLLALMGPKESGFINSIDGFNAKPSLEWTFYESLTEYLSLKTNAFNIQDRLE